MRILETVLYAEDLDAARRFYVGLLGLEEISFDPDRDLFLKCENGVLILFKASKTLVTDAGVPGHGTTGAGHMAFSATHQELDQWTQRLESKGVSIVQHKTWRNGARSIYFLDPAGNILEFATPDLWGIGEL